MEDSFIRPDELWKKVGLKAEQTVAHLGAGPGYYIIPAAHIVGPKGQAIGIDVLPDMLAEIESRAARENIKDIVQTIRANLENDPGSPLKNASLDWVLVANILHLSDSAKILKEAARLVRPQGKVLIIEWSTAASPFGPPTSHRLAKADILTAAAQHGLVMKEDFEPSPYHYGLILTKS